jgi:hypothetical protein
MDTESNTNPGTENEKTEEKVDISKLVEGIVNGTDSACKTRDPMVWRRAFETAISAIAIKSYNARKKADEYSEKAADEGRHVIDVVDGKTKIDPEYKKLGEAAHSALKDSVDEVTDILKPHPEIEKWMQENKGRNWLKRSVPVEDIVVFEDGYGRGSVFSYDDDDSNDHTDEVDEYETLYVKVLGNIDDTDHQIIKELETAACFLSRNGYYLPMKERVALVMDAFVKVFRKGWKWAFFIPHFVGSC